MTAPGHAMPADRALRVRLLGGFAVDGFDQHALGTRKARVFLKRLAVARGRPVSSEDLAAAVWPDGLPQSPGDQLSVLASRLRAVVGTERIRRSDAGYSLVADWVDIDELEAKATELDDRLRAGDQAAAHAAGHAALALVDGSLLPEEDAPWVDAARPAVDRLTARVRLLAAQAALGVGEVAAAKAAAQSALDHDPYDEAALRVVMQADALAGRSGAALAAYAALRSRLVDELGADPDPETEAIHAAILRGELAAPAGDRSPNAGLVGRDAERRQLDGFLARAASGDAVGAVVEGPAGIGKSALAAAWAAQLRDRAVVITGQCDALGFDLPLQPVLDGLAAHLAGLGQTDATALLAAEATVLEPLLARGVPSGPRATTVTDPDIGRTVVFGALTNVLRRAAADRPLVVVVDDLHLAAPGTAELLQFAMRRINGVVVLATRRPEPGPDLPDAHRIALGPLTLADAVALYGPDRGPLLHGRSDGHPLLLQALASAGSDAMPASILAAIRAQIVQLGLAKATIEAAACCGTEVDVDLVTATSGRGEADVLDDLEAATRAGLLRPRGRTLAFAHELVREAIDSNTSPARRDAIHRAAIAHLATRPAYDPLALARHARLAGDPRTAAQALTAAADRAAERYEAEIAERLLDEAIGLADDARAHLARGRLRIARLDLDGARDDAARAIELSAGVEGFELAGWVAYYRREHDAAIRYADEGVARAEAPGLRASCLALSGRIRHSRGDLAIAHERLEEGVAIAPPGIRGMVQVWHAQLLAHCGEAERAAEEARRGLLDPRMAHPFATGHGWFTLAYALGIAGRWSEALAAVDALDEAIVRSGDQRFPPVAANGRGWLLRGAGLIDQSIDLHQQAAETAPGPTFLEARYAALLDLAECHLAAGELGEAEAVLAAGEDITGWTGAMSWRHRNRYRLHRDRLASLGGAHADAADDLRDLAATSAARGDPRYERRALLAAATIDARAGTAIDSAELASLVEAFAPIAGPDGWRDVGELALAARSEQLWRRAERLAATIVQQADSRPGLDRADVATAVRAQLDRFRP